MRWFLFITLLLVGCAKDSLHRSCPYECWAVPGVSDGVYDEEDRRGYKYILNGKDRAGIGQCQAGISVCDENFNITECTGEVLPSHEVCDNVDNDCDGWVDDGFGSDHLTLYNTEDICRQRGVCNSPKAECNEGEWTCQYPNTYEDEESICDGLDNDCDGRVDENLYAGEFCYEVPEEEWWTATNDPCRPGVYMCVDGWKQCVGQVLPSIELCDNIDNDCNSIIDDTGDILEADYDIVFIVDTSGSMCSYIQAVASALDAYVEQFEGNTYFRFALVSMSATPGDKVQVLIPFGDLNAIRNRLLAMSCNGSGAEASLDSMQMVCDSSDPLGLGWRADANRLFFAFTDEVHQSYTIPLTTGQNVVNSCVASSTLPFIWGSVPSNFPNICINANGLYFSLSSWWGDIFDDLNAIVITLCGA